MWLTAHTPPGKEGLAYPRPGPNHKIHDLKPYNFAPNHTIFLSNHTISGVSGKCSPPNFVPHRKCVFPKHAHSSNTDWAWDCHTKMFEKKGKWNCMPQKYIFKEWVCYPRPVLAFGYCRWLRLSVCVCGKHLLVRAITCHAFKLESPNLDHKSKTPWLRSLLFWGVIDLELQGQI